MIAATRTFAALGGYVVLAIVTLPSTAEAPSGVSLQSAARRTEALIEVVDVSRPVVDARLLPYAAIGKFKGTMACTAAIVFHPRIIVTAGHCITERDGTTKRSNLSFRPGYQAGTDLGRFEATVWAIGSKQSFKRQSVHDAAQDWVILVLDRAPAGVQPLLLSHYSFETLKSLQRRFLMPSYSSDVGGADVLSVDPTCSIRNLVWDALVHDCAAQLGSSGAPLLIQDRLRYAVVGIHTGSMFASGKDGHVAKFVGNRAIGSWMFKEALLALSRRLNDDAAPDVESTAY